MPTAKRSKPRWLDLVKFSPIPGLAAAFRIFVTLLLLGPWGRSWAFTSILVAQDSASGTSSAARFDSTAVVADTSSDSGSAAKLDSSKVVSHPVGTPKAAAPRWSFETHGALLWNIFDVARVRQWERAVSGALKADTIGTGASGDSTTKSTLRIDRDFESFNNSFSPAAGVGLRSPRGRLQADLQAQYLWLTKQISYSELGSDSSRLAGEDEIRVKAVPLVFGISTAIAETLFSVAGFDRVDVGVNVVAIPWTGLAVSGNRQPDLDASGHGFGFGVRLAIARPINQRFLYRGELRYLSAWVSSFNKADGARLLESDLAGGEGGEPFELDIQIIQFQIQVAYGRFKVPSRKSCS